MPRVDRNADRDMYGSDSLVRNRNEATMFNDKSFVEAQKCDITPIASDELSNPQQALTKETIKQPGQKGKRNRLSILGISDKDLNASPEEWRNAMETANSYRKLRQKELYVAHGYVSSGAGSLLASEALALAASRFIYAEVTKTGNLSLVQTAMRLSEAAQKHALAAWELCAREAHAKRKTEYREQALPWMKHQDGGEERRGPKHKHNPIDVESYPSSQASRSPDGEPGNEEEGTIG